MKAVTLIRICRWVFRLTLLAVAAPVAYVGLAVIRGAGEPAFGIFFLLTALMLPGAELFFNWLNKLEDKEK
jgi:hypothetical protein